MAKVKLIDVAELARVSKSTVSQFLNGRFDFMSEATRERIQAAVAELNYVPNPIARSLKTSTTKTIGLIVRDVTGYYTCRTIRGIDDYCKSSDYNVIIYNTDFDPETELRSLKALNQLRIDGLIIASSGQNDELIAEYEKKGLPVVQFQLEHNDREKSIILSDYQQSAFEATEYLIELGHERICFVTQDFEQVKSRKERYLGYVAALEKHGIALDQSLISHWHRGHGLEQSPGQIIRSTGATAFFSQHLAITIDLLKALEQDGIAIPQDASVLGFDELPMAEFFKVPVTVIRQSAYQTGQLAAELLLERVKDSSLPAKRVTLPCQLIERESCQKVTPKPMEQST